MTVKSVEPLKINDILFEIKGRAKVNWTSKSAKHYSSSEPYFCEQFALSYVNKLESACDSSNPKVQSENVPRFLNQPSLFKARILPGRPHKLEIPFSYTLPKALPTSFEGEFGFIRYTCRAILERPWDFDVICCRAFTVVGIEDINDEVHLFPLK
jgi:hypothetical protein